jgi:hypothetical protein
MPREEPEAPRPGRLQRLAHKFFWLHSLGALSFGVVVMLFARKGLDYADAVMIVLGVSWLLVFVAFRFIVGARNRRPDEKLTRKGLRLLTNYVIKQLYQQMYFFLVPLYALSATWSLTSANWWLVPILLLCAVLSTMDLIFDNFIMEHRFVASAMYGLCMFGVLNVILPLTLGLGHFPALLAAAAATAPTVALLTFELRAVVSARGIVWTLAMTAALVTGAYYGRAAIPPVPTALAAAAVGHGAPGAYECVPGPREEIRADQLDQLRCVTRVAAPGGLREPLVHVWRHRGEVRFRIDPVPMAVDACGEGVLRSEIASLPDDPLGLWSCTVETEAGQLVGRVSWKVVGPPAPSAPAD